MSKGPKRRTDSTLDLLLKQGASGKKVNIDKAVASTTHRLIREKILFTKAVGSLDITFEYKQSGFIVLEPMNETAAKQRLSGKTRTKLTGRSKKLKKAFNR